MLAHLQNRFPIFIRDICRTFGNYSKEGGHRVCILPSYITPEVIKYCKKTNNPDCNDFLTKIPSWFLSNHCENRHRIVEYSKDNIIYEKL